MFAFLDWLSFDGLMKWAHDVFVMVWETLRDLLWAAILPLFGALTSAVAAVGDYIVLLNSALSGITPYLSFANAWVPVDLFFQLASAYSSLWLSLLIYRTVKSWLPTLSGS